MPPFLPGSHGVFFPRPGHPPSSHHPPRPAGDFFGFIEVEKFHKTPCAVEAIIFPAAVGVGETHGKNPSLSWRLEDSPFFLRDVMVIKQLLWRVRFVFFFNMDDVSMSPVCIFWGLYCRPAHVLQKIRFVRMNKLRYTTYQPWLVHQQTWIVVYLIWIIIATWWTPVLNDIWI